MEFHKTRIPSVPKMLATPESTDSPALNGAVLEAERLFAEGDVLAACLAYEKILAVAPACVSARIGLVKATTECGNVEEARAIWRKLALLHAADSFFWRQLAMLCVKANDNGEVASCLERVTELEPHDPVAWRMLGRSYLDARQLERTKTCLERALALNPGDDASIGLLGWVRNETGDVDGALEVLHSPRAESSVSFARALRRKLLLPPVYRDLDDLTRWRQRYIAGLSELSADPGRYCPDPREVFRLTQSNFYLAYQGSDDLPPQQSYADLIGKLIARARPDLLGPVARNAPTGKIRVAFVSSDLRNCTVGHYFRSWIERLDSTRFESIVIHAGGSADAVSHEIGARASRFELMRGDPLEVAAAVREMRPDILIYPEIGMQTLNCLLAHMRLAPVQCAAWGHPVTTGSKCIDYYFTCDGMEPPDGHRHYSETLLRLPGIGTHYGMPTTKKDILARETFGLSRDRRLYCCPQSLFKIHPDNDRLYLDIMETDEHSVILFFQSDFQQVTLSFANRMARGMAARGLPQRKQIKFLPLLGAEAFRSVLRFSDVILDTLHWSGGNTSLDALSIGAPIVTLPGSFMRGRQSQAMLRAIGTAELIAENAEDYVAIAMRVAADRDLQQVLKTRIIENQGELFDSEEPIRALMAHLEHIR